MRFLPNLSRLMQNSDGAREPAFSLVEAVFSSFILLACILMSVSLFDKTLQTEVSNEERTLAALAAESAMAEVRLAAQLNFAEVRERYDGKTIPLENFPEFTITCHVEPTRLAIPCNPLEEAQYPESTSFPEPGRRYLHDSVWAVQVDVTWQDRGAKKVSLTENVVDLSPGSEFEVVICDKTGAAISPGLVLDVPKRGTLEFQAKAVSSSGEVKDIQFTWYVETLTGVGSIQRVSRDGRQCEYFNGYRINGRIVDAPGACNLVLEASFQGLLFQDKVRVDNAE